MNVPAAGHRLRGSERQALRCLKMEVLPGKFQQGRRRQGRGLPHLAKQASS
jgi:hypothetical protein